MLIIVEVVADVARANGVSSTDPFVAKVLSPTNFMDKLCTHFAFQLLHNLLATLHSSFTVQPRHGLAFAIPRLALCITTPLHANCTSATTSKTTQYTRVL